MIQDLKTFESLPYVCKEDKIGYKYLDGISFKLNYGYQTLFTYFLEFEAGNITSTKLEQEIAITLFCGSFSYAEIPKQYTTVCGVTGTLETLSAPERRLLEDIYDIRKHTYMPSVYFKSNLAFRQDFSGDVILVSSLFGELRNEIDRRIECVNGTRYRRAVLVFFESTPKLKAFYNSRELFDIKERVKIMTEETSPTEKEGIIRQAVTTGSITLLNRYNLVFGRGTDFICYDDRLLKSGGVHVISTFVSAELSEEVGRI